MPRRVKRAIDVVDLTGEEPHQAQQKRQALGTTQQSRLNANAAPVYSSGIGGTSVYSSSPSYAACPPSQSSSQISGRQGHHPASQSFASTQEPDVLDLTQQDDGPPKELYGSLRTFHESLPHVI
jgi:SWI/SNF-related matrix-associated actin-dependent regulator of chromatin subfamily A3